MTLDDGATTNIGQLATLTYVNALTGKNTDDACTTSTSEPTGVTCVDSWYAPSITEFLLLTEQMKIGSLDTALTTYGGTPLLTTSIYWTSNENTGNTQNAYALHYQPESTPSAIISDETKQGLNSLRVIRQF